MPVVRAVTVIPPTIDLHTHIPTMAMRKRRVAGYARVSTDSDEQFTSYEAQIDYYTQYIQSKPEWEFVSVYTDEGISGLNTKRREGFNQMISDALAGKIDLIVTKSVSRFARNTVDSLSTIRKLKEHHVEVYFEKEAIWTFDSKGELLLTIMSSLAQEESRSISENVTWGQRRRFEEGKVSVAYKQFLGYEKGPGGFPKIVPEQAAVVRRIYDLFMEGKTPSGIARLLTGEGIPTPAGKRTWQASTVLSILTNEKYKGDARLQKKFTVDFINKKMKVNEGEVPQYYVEHSHEAIIAPELFERVQEEILRRKAIGRKYSGKSVFSCRIVCGDCGEYLGAKVWNSNDKYRRIVWQCNDKFQGGKKCATPHLTEDFIKEKFLEAFNRLIPDRERLIEDCRLMQSVLTDCDDIERGIKDLLQEIEVVAGLTKRCVDENSRSALDQEEYLARYNGLVERYDQAKAQVAVLEKKRSERMAKAHAIGEFICELSDRDETLTHFDERLWREVIDVVTVYRDSSLVFRFQNGTEIKV